MNYFWLYIILALTLPFVITLIFRKLKITTDYAFVAYFFTFIIVGFISPQIAFYIDNAYINPPEIVDGVKMPKCGTYYGAMGMGNLFILTPLALIFQLLAFTIFELPKNEKDI
jgi:hypothetical protein